MKTDALHVFVSYAQEDEARVRPLVRILEKHGLSVFWDRHVPAGEDYRRFISRALKEAGCVVVAWSQYSEGSSWVHEEAEDGLKRRVLVPILLDHIEIPLGFRHRQAVDLTIMKPHKRSVQIDKLLNDIESILRTAGKMPTERSTTSNVEQPEPLQRKARAKKHVYLKQLIQIGEVRLPKTDPRSRNFYDGSTGEREIYVSVAFAVAFAIPFALPPSVIVSLHDRSWRCPSEHPQNLRRC